VHINVLSIVKQWHFSVQEFEFVNILHWIEIKPVQMRRLSNCTAVLSWWKLDYCVTTEKRRTLEWRGIGEEEGEVFYIIFVLFCRSVNSLQDQSNQKAMQAELFQTLKNRQKWTNRLHKKTTKTLAMRLH